MGTVADVNYGFKGEVTSAQTPLIFGIGSRYAVIGTGLKATAGGAGDRAVTVSPGVAWGDGVLSMWNTSGTVNAAANGTGQTRWDTLVVRRHWQPASTPRGTSTLMLLTGGAQKAVAVSRKTDRGVTDSDQPIALVPIAPGSAVAGTPVGLRCWSGAGGGLVAESVEALQYLAEVGSVVQVGTDEWVCRLDATNTPVFVARRAHQVETSSGGTDTWIKTDEVVVATNANGDFSIVFPTPFPTQLISVVMQESSLVTVLQGIGLKFTSASADRTRITGRAYRFSNGTAIASTSIRVNYVAVGR